jgi:LuxR family quorum sensing-dependent transcriptional regulator
MIEQSTDKGSMQECLVNIAKSFGFTSVFGGIVPQNTIRGSRIEIEARAVVQHFPAGWAARYVEQNYLPRDPIVQRLQRDHSLFSWSDSYTSCSEPDDARVVGGEAADFGLVEGFVIPVRTLDDPIAALSFGGTRDDLNDNDRSALTFIANFAVGHWLGLRRPQSLAKRSVSPREFDCLLWAGEGKTDWEISVILGISRATVTKHVASAREKLGAANKTHAVAIAMRMKILG